MGLIITVVGISHSYPNVSFCASHLIASMRTAAFTCGAATATASARLSTMRRRRAARSCTAGLLTSPRRMARLWRRREVSPSSSTWSLAGGSPKTSGDRTSCVMSVAAVACSCSSDMGRSHSANA